MEKSINEILEEWCKISNIDENKIGNVWTVIPSLPQYKFLNLQLKEQDIEEECIGEHNEEKLTFNYDVLEFHISLKYFRIYISNMKPS